MKDKTIQTKDVEAKERKNKRRDMSRKTSKKNYFEK